ncbi:hypothetical protein ABFS83_04G160800 [Erythranthe nasuta]
MVRKEKMGDRVTALQQLVSPFGKTDTASVLSDAIEYIKFLHEQISVFPLGILRVSSSVFYNTVPHSCTPLDCTGYLICSYYELPVVGAPHVLLPHFLLLKK